MPEDIPFNRNVHQQQHQHHQRQQRQQPIRPEDIPINRNVYQQHQQFMPPAQQINHNAGRQSSAGGIASCLMMAVLVIGGIALLFWLVPLALHSFASSVIFAVVIVVVIILAIFASKGRN